MKTILCLGNSKIQSGVTKTKLLPRHKERRLLEEGLKANSLNRRNALSGRLDQYPTIENRYHRFR